MSEPDAVRIAIVGAGFAGVGMAIRLRQEGIEDFVVLERAQGLGGTWRDNTYPGCACDIPSHLYSFSFAPNPDWSRYFSPQAEIRGYMRRCVERFGVSDHIRYGHGVESAAWDAERARWRIETAAGSLSAEVLILGTGPLSEPKLPDIPGLESFRGPAFHSAAWDHDLDLEGKRVAVVGTGASAIQIVPKIAPHVAKLHLFQRTPPWVVPQRDRPVTRLERTLFRRVPAVQRLVRARIYWQREAIVPALMGAGRFQRLIQRVGRLHLRTQVDDPALRERLKPRYAMGCKRILVSDDYYPALNRPNVEVVTEGIREVRPTGIVTADGAEREVDAIVLGTGFHVTDVPAAEHLFNGDGVSLTETWNGSPQAYRGTTVAGFPNLFILVGPNTGLGHNSILFMIESQVAYVLDALRLMEKRRLASVEVREEAQVGFNAEVQARMRGSVWTDGGCASWYLDAEGRNTTLWPGYTWRFRQLTRRFDPAAYVLRPRVARAAGVEARV